MTTAALIPYRSTAREARDGFPHLVHAEWTKFRSVRGWLVAMAAVALVTVGISQLNHSSCGTVLPDGSSTRGCSTPTGPGGQAVTDDFYYVHQPLAADGTVTAQVTSLTGPDGTGPDGTGPASLSPWSKAGILIKANTRPGSAYAAMMVTAGHGVRMQYDFTGDIPGPAGPVDTAPRWLRLTRSGDTLTGYWSADGRQWTQVGRVRLSGLPGVVQAGLFTAAPGTSQSGTQSLGGSTGTGGIALASARFDNVSLQASQPAGKWSGEQIGAQTRTSPPPGLGFTQADGMITVTGTGDIAPQVPSITGGGDGGIPMERTLLGMFVGLIVVIVVAAMFMTAEYRRSLIRITLTASPRRGRVLAAKAVVTGAVTFLAGLAGAGVALPLGERLMRSNGNYMLSVSTLTEVRLVVGSAGLLAVAAVLTLALGTLLKSSAAAITAAVTTTALPYLLATFVLPAGVADWLLRLTPAAGFAIQQSIPRYPQVAASYTPADGYYPLAPWAGFAVLCGYATLALALAAVRLRRRDA